MKSVQKGNTIYTITECSGYWKISTKIGMIDVDYKLKKNDGDTCESIAEYVIESKDFGD